MSFEIPEQCINCPKIAPYIQGLEEVERTRSQTVASAEEFMAGEESGAEVTAQLEEFLEQHEIILRDAEVTIHHGGHSRVENAADLLAKLLERAGRASDKARFSTVDVLQATDNATEAYNRMIEMFTKDCKHGTKMRKKYILFGRKVAKCSSVSFARIVPQRFLE